MLASYAMLRVDMALRKGNRPGGDADRRTRDCDGGNEASNGLGSTVDGITSRSPFAAVPWTSEVAMNATTTTNHRALAAQGEAMGPRQCDGGHGWLGFTPQKARCLHGGARNGSRESLCRRRLFAWRWMGWQQQHG